MVAPVAATLPPPLPRRVSYVVPLPSNSPPVLLLPPPNAKQGRPSNCAPIYTQLPPSQSASTKIPRFVDRDEHPRHRLAVQALALDLSTAIDQDSSPGGILYTGGRDGLVASWELGLTTKKRKRRYGFSLRSVGGARNSKNADDDSDSERSEDSDDDEGEEGFIGRRESIATFDLEDAGAPFLKKKVKIGAAGGGGGGRPRRSSSVDTTREGDTPMFSVEEKWEIDQEKPGFSPPKAKFRQCLQSHTDWVNDIVLCDYNRTLVSASSDSLLVAWNPHSANHDDQVTPKHIGRHGDYVKCLASSREAGWVASGGFDRKIKLWDVAEGRSTPLVELPSPPASIYSLAATESGSLLAAGTPERVIRIWDPRSRKQVSRLGGHTDNIRAVLLSEDGKTVLSASSDSTVKLWSLSSQKCLHTFSHHSSPVWSLFSQHPSLSRFYSGDRSGNICKIDLEGTGDPGEGECIVLARDSPEESSDVRPGSEGITQLVAKDDSWVWSAGGSSSVKRWKDVLPRSKRAGAISVRSSTSNTGTRQRSGTLDSEVFSTSESTDYLLNTRTQTPPPPTDRQGFSVSFLEDLTSTLSRTTSSPSPRPSSTSVSAFQFPGSGRPSSLRTRPTHHQSPSQPTTTRPSIRSPAQEVGSGNSTPGIPGASADTLFEIPYDSLVPLTSPEDTYFAPTFTSPTRFRDPDTATIYSSISVVSVPFGSSSFISRSALAASPPPSGVKRPVSLAETTFDADTQATALARRDYIERESATEASPLRTSPEDVIEGRVGLMRCELLSDRRHALTIDTDNEILLWDIVEARCLGVFSQDDLNSHTSSSRRPSDTLSASTNGSGSGGSGNGNGEDLLDFVKERIDGEGSAATWCKADTRVGALTIHLEENRVFDGEVYVDEAHLGPASATSDFPPDHRLVMGKWVLRHLFSNFIDAEVQQRGTTNSSNDPVSSSVVNSSPNSHNPPRFISLADLGPPTSPRIGLAKTPGMTIALATPAARKAVLPLLPMPTQSSPRAALWDLTPIPPSPLGTPRIPDFGTNGPGTPTGARTPTASGARSDDYFSWAPAPATEAPLSPSVASPSSPTPVVAPLPTPGGTLMGRLRLLGKGSKKTTAAEALDLTPATTAAPEAAVSNGVIRTVEEEQQHRLLEAVFSHPITPCPPFDAPPLYYDPHMAVLLSEETADASAWAVTYRGLVGTGREDMHVLEQKSPLWLLDFLLGNRAVIKEPSKISFVIQPWIDTVKAGLPELPNANARLTAARSLRMKKVMAYVADRLDLRDPTRSRAPSISGASGKSVNGDAEPASTGTPRDANFIPEQELEILCGEVLLHSRMTLATVRTYYWKNGGDVVLSYRRKLVQVAQAPVEKVV